MGGIDAYREARETLHDRHVPKIDEVSVRVAQVRLDTAEAEDDPAVSPGSHILTGVQSLVQGDAHATLEQHRKLLLLTDRLQELEVLSVAGADLKHDPRRVTGLAQRAANLIQLRFVRGEKLVDGFLVATTRAAQTQLRLVGVSPHGQSPQSDRG